MSNKLLNVAIVAGGYSGEYEVSLRSASGIMSWMDVDLFSPYLVIIKRDEWQVVLQDGAVVPVCREDFSFLDTLGQHIKFDYAFITIHGTPGENGLLQGYLDMLGVPYNTGDVLVESLTFNKFVCNKFLSTFPGIRVARAYRLAHCDTIPSTSDIVSDLGLPLFIKPNVGGSSVATTKVKDEEGIMPAIQSAFEEGNEIMVESFIKGTEVTCGCYALGGEIHPLPVTEVVTHNEFFDFNAKYNGQVEEITPARISAELTERIQSLTAQIYHHLRTKGIIRVDFIIEPDGIPTLLEVNTTPGMTPTSFLPQQVAAAGLEMKTLLSDIIMDQK